MQAGSRLSPTPDAGAPLLVVPFFRASVRIGAAERRLFARGLPAGDLERTVRGCDIILRQNLHRLFAAAALAESTGGSLALLEGWRSNPETGRRRNRVVTGSWCLAAFLRLLQRRRLTAYRGRPVRRDLSRCTWEEAAAAAALARERGARLVGVAGLACPSALRAERTLRLGGGQGRVLTPERALAEAGLRPTADQAGLLAALRPTAVEVARARLVELPNWALHAATGAGRTFRPRAMPLEQWLARRLRPDQGSRHR